MTTAVVQLSRGIDEAVSDVKITRSPDGRISVATFFLNTPNCMKPENMGNADITGFYMIDEEGEIVTRTVNGKFINGQQAGIEAIYKMTSEYEWERFLRFMNRYAESNGMSLSRPEA